MFTDIALHPELENNLKAAGYLEATEVQQRAVPLLLEGQDLLVSAPTGSGKTAAFLIPLIQSMVGQQSPAKQPRALVLVPVRELADQILQQFSKLAQNTELSAVSVVGGEDFKVQEKRLASADLVIATPGRLLPHIENQSIEFDSLDFLVLDEADRMLETGFKESLQQILSVCPDARQTLLISATLPTAIRSLANEILDAPEWVQVGQKREAAEGIKQYLILSDDVAHKDKQLCALLKNEEYTKAIVFSNSKTQARRLDGFLRYHKLKAALLHGDVQQKGRFATIEGFRKGTTTVLVTTDLASRGLDVEDVDLVINFEMPRKGDVYLHRIGRTGRAGAEGEAVSLVDATEWNLMSSIERYLKTRFRRKLIEGLVGNYKGPKKLKASGKAASSKKKKKDSAVKKKAPRKAKR
ncbi:DEAD/DEAH box helicase [Neptuniibacter sp. 1_MG-2023]|uniref:DEAD/DEAH box helicase n=1 Tax=Neptuniibacter sp. 1_MG-2023 TaxID=3062662 RepID=UPI0026E18B8C|nr:DEAD/DEAH box helicase [Neptuniibacter sp. 1_MG-2023]MDO6593439.1 DEAD/DEAH box helicase [Neptuniibacter sp. 1_MG-2023]